MTITQIQQAKKNEERVNIFLDDRFWVGLTKDELISFELFKGKIITKEEKIEIEKSSSLTKVMYKAVNCVQIRPRSEMEMEQYLYRKQIDKETSGQDIQKLKDKKLLSDEQFALWLVEQRLHSGRYG